MAKTKKAHLTTDEYYPVVVVTTKTRGTEYEVDADLLRDYERAYSEFDRLNGLMLKAMGLH